MKRSYLFFLRLVRVINLFFLFLTSILFTRLSLSSISENVIPWSEKVNKSIWADGKFWRITDIDGIATIESPKAPSRFIKIFVDFL